MAAALSDHRHTKPNERRDKWDYYSYFCMAKSLRKLNLPRCMEIAHDDSKDTFHPARSVSVSITCSCFRNRLPLCSTSPLPPIRVTVPFSPFSAPFFTSTVQCLRWTLTWSWSWSSSWSWSCHGCGRVMVVVHRWYQARGKTVKRKPPPPPECKVLERHYLHGNTTKAN